MMRFKMTRAKWSELVGNVQRFAPVIAKGDPAELARIQNVIGPQLLTGTTVTFAVDGATLVHVDITD